ncbi:MAG: hypothetical protein IJL76_01270 [Bacilli bacterium]|nr:hypothetical protein [Bacilli bacterium]
MNKLIVISPEGDAYNKEIAENYEHVDALKDYLNENNISYNEEINNGHKLCLDLSRKGYWIFRVGGASIMYIGKQTTNEQFDWYSHNTDLIDQMNIISVASWYDTDYDRGYDIIEQGGIGFNTFEQRRDRINDLIIEKNKDFEKNGKKSKFGFFRRAK